MANLEGDLKLIDQPGSVEYRPDPNSYMSLSVLQENRQYLVGRLAVWESRKVQPNSRKKWVENAQKGIDRMKAKIALYDAAIAAIVPVSTPVVTDIVPDTGAGATDDVSLPSTSGSTPAQSGLSPAVTAGQATGSTGVKVAAATAAAQGFFATHKKKIFIGLGILAAAVVAVVVIKRRK